MLHVAFIRNVNQGQRGHPAADDILAAFRDGGAHEAACFQSNGTVVFRASDADATVERAMDALAARTGLPREAYTIPLDRLADIAAASSTAPDVDRRELTIHAGGILDITDPATTREAAHRRCTFVDAGDGWVVTLNERPNESNATPVVERLTGAPTTSRSLGTILRLLDRFPAG